MCGDKRNKERDDYNRERITLIMIELERTIAQARSIYSNTGIVQKLTVDIRLVESDSR